MLRRLFSTILRGAILFAGYPALGSVSVDTPPFFIRPLLDEKLVAAKGTFQMPSGAHVLTFRVLTSPEATKYGVRRFRTRLENYDNTWAERPSDMAISLRFSDEHRNQLSAENLVVLGKSPGWKDSLERSMFTHRVESLHVPDNAAFFNMVITSAGPPTSIGLLAVTNIQVRDRSAPEAPIFIYPEPSGENQKPEDITNWVRSGIRPMMTALLPTQISPGHPALAIRDDSVLSHAEWALQIRRFVKVRPGAQLEVSWDELYNIGEGAVTEADLAKLPPSTGTAGTRFSNDDEKPGYALGAKTVDYRRLPPGTYTFRVQGLDWLGDPLPIESVFRFTVDPPFWQQPLVLVSGLTLALAAAGLGLRRRSNLHTRREMERLRQDHLLEMERLRIARNIHDDLGARLTHISLVSENARRATGISSEAAGGFEAISRMTRDLVSSLYETIWAVDPQNDNLESLLDFLCEMVQKLCESAQLRCKISLPESSPSFVVSSDVRHHLVLAIKETVNNAIKHSGASCIELTARFSKTQLVMEVSDDGQGFDPATVQEGHGLENVRRRMEDLHGTCHMERRERGMRVTLEAPFTG